jgi:GTPase Era involved in 16S rRNA processing
LTGTEELFDEIRADLIAVCARILDQASKHKAPFAAADLAEAASRLADGKLKVACVGEYSRGKSTLLNVLLDQKRDLLPTASIPKTRLITRVEYGPVEEYFLVDTGGQETAIGRTDIERYAAEPDDSAALNQVDERKIVIRLPNEKLKSGLVLLDTPGVGGIHAAHQQVAERALAEADAIIFVAGATEPLTGKELRFLELAGNAVRARETRDAMLIAFNMIDRLSPYERELKACRDVALDRTGLQRSELPVLPVSAKDKQFYLRSGDAAFLMTSRIPELDAVLWSRLLRRRVRVLLGDAADRAGQTIERVLTPLVAAERTLRDESGDELRRLASETASKQARLVQLEDEGAAWRGEIAVALVQLGEKMIERCTGECARIWERAENDLLRDRYYLIDPRRLGHQLNSLFRAQLNGTESWASREAGRLQRDCAARWGLELAGTALDGISDISVLDLPDFDVLKERIRTVTRTTPQTRIYRGEAMVTPAGRKANLFQRTVVKTGSIFGEGVKRAAAGLVNVNLVPQYETHGGETYTEEVNEGYSPQELDRRRKELQDTLADARRAADPLIQQTVQAAVTALSAAIALEMERQITLERETLNRMLPMLEAQTADTREQRDARLTALAELIRPLKALRQRVRTLRKETVNLTRVVS